ncbi:Internalin-related protein [Flavobacterium anhuiense]|uniref:Internalin-related protein n=1 Tax=Flavobacterium anhuiense TaxID=459526 RepID=A0A444VYM7_9FLAO|nr:T9SS type A sorting domain-containing protein [Flavobacterium anhuiense]RYJ38612.1 Internalin-related protein [Flavobacterium anhuiense]
MIKNYLLLLTLCFFSSSKAQIITFPDANFKAKLLQANGSNTIAKDLNSNYFKIDSNNNGEIEIAEALNVSYLDLRDSNIASLDQLSNFSNLTDFNCSNNNLGILDVSSLKKLTRLVCSSNLISDLNLSDLSKISSLICGQNKLTSLNVSNLTELNIIECNNNDLQSLDVSNSSHLRELVCYKNKLTELKLPNSTVLWFFKCAQNLLPSLDIAKLPGLEYLDFWDNKITFLDFSNSKIITDCYGGANPIESIDLSNQVLLETLWIGHTLIKTLDISSSKNLKELNISDCPNLEFLNIKNGAVKNLSFLETPLSSLGYNGFNLSNCPNLQYICDDDFNLALVTEKIAPYRYENCLVGNYCSFEPGGTNYTIKGKSQIDVDSNGCDTGDIGAKYLKFSIFDGTKLEYFTADSNDEYALKIPAGSYKVTPIVENSSYFTVLPSYADVVFPTQVSLFNQNFCIVPNGVHNDLEINIIPIDAARPGFDAKYKLVYKNKGNTVQSGTVNLNFDDSILDFVSSNSVVSSQSSGKLVWNFSNLKPFESREIDLVLNVNSPVETPAINIGDILKYKAIINSAETDETSEDNVFELAQTVVGSYDPNDKICLEGKVIKPELIGQYVHYLIRFENTGTYNAENVVIKDVIDISKFDISTLIPTSASHAYEVKVSDVNKIEFIFKKIDLPFDDAHNDGYIAFKIKTLPTLKVGDLFENEANIYFDYNFPILTNKATSTFKTLGRPDFELSSHLNIYPNPVRNYLQIESKDLVEIESIYVYNVLGQVIEVIPNAQNISKIDVSKFQSGNYILQVKTASGGSIMKFVKI